MKTFRITSSVVPIVYEKVLRVMVPFLPYFLEQRLRFFCRCCARAVCISCTDIEHRGHKTSKIEEAATEARLALNRAIENAESQVTLGLHPFLSISSWLFVTKITQRFFGLLITKA